MTKRSMDSKELRLTLPLRIRASKRGKFYALNLNIYRNLHYAVLGNLKSNFTQLIEQMLSSTCSVGMFKKPYISYTFYADNNRTTDLMNWVSVIDKFVMDALVAHHTIVDDSTEFIKEVHVKYGGVDKGRGRLEMEIRE